MATPVIPTMDTTTTRAIIMAIADPARVTIPARGIIRTTMAAAAVTTLVQEEVATIIQAAEMDTILAPEMDIIPPQTYWATLDMEAMAAMEVMAV